MLINELLIKNLVYLLHLLRSLRSSHKVYSHTNFLLECQVFTKCVHGEDHACNMHAKAFCVHENSCTVLIPLRKNNLNLLISYTDHYYCFKKIKTTTTTVFLISNTVVPNPYSHSTAFDPHLLHPYLKGTLTQIWKSTDIFVIT